MALIRFVIDLIGGDTVELPVVISTPMPVRLFMGSGPQVVKFTVSNPMSRDVVLENISGAVTVGDPSLVTFTVLDTVLSVAAGQVRESSVTVTPNQQIDEDVILQIEVTGNEA